MKKLILGFTVLLGALNSQASVLKCWRTNFKQANVPFLTAEILADDKIADVRFLYKKSMAEFGVTIKDHPGVVAGNLITTGHSPYKNAMRYFVSGAGHLILPSDLSNENLAAVEPKGLGYYKGENGVLISSADDSGDGAGNHVSYRLSCRSNK